MPADFDGNTDSVNFLLSNGTSNFPTNVVWNASGNLYVAKVSASVTDAGDYNLTAACKGFSMGGSTWKVKKASLQSLTYELTADKYVVGQTPAVKKAMLGTVDVTNEINELISDGDIDLQARATYSGSEVLPSAFEAGTSYTTVILANGSATNYEQSTFTSEANAKSFTAIAKTDTSDSQAAFRDGKALEGIDQDGKAVKADDKGRFSVVSDGENPMYVIPTSVMPKGGENAVEVVPVYEKSSGVFVEADAANLYKAIYKDANNDGVKESALDSIDDVKAAGTYLVAVRAKDATSVYAGETMYVPMTVKAHAFDSVTIYNKADNAANDVTKTSFVYNGASYQTVLGNLGFAIDGNAAKTVTISKVYGSDGKEISSASSSSAVMPAGTYTVVATVDGTAGVEATFTVDKLDLAQAVVVTSDVELAGSTEDYTEAQNGTTVNKAPISTLGSDVDFSVSKAITNVGSYKATVSAKKDNPNVTGTATVDFNVVKSLKSENPGNGDASATGKTSYLTYAGKAWDEVVDTDSSSSSYKWAWATETFAATGAGAFDESLVGIDLGGTIGELDSDEYTVTVLDQKGNEVDSLAANQAYTLVVRIVPNDDFEYGGTFTRTILVQDGSFSDSDVTVTYKGDVVGNTIAADYTGKNVMDDIAVTVKDGKKTLTEGKEYELVLKKDGKVVDEAVDAGIYTLSFKGITYASKATDINIVVGDMQVTGLRVQPSDTGVVAWTGEAVTPVIEYTLDSQAKIDAGTAEWSVLPADFYVAKYFDEDMKVIDGAVDEGTYYVTVSPSTKAENISFKAKTIEFTVSKTVAGFVDVSTSEWYANVVAKANELGYMTGISGTAMFAPNATITRAEVAEVFAKMAGLELDKDKTYPTKFSDVASDAWFAQSVAWASQAGIVGGYEGTDLFGSFDNATREQVATMIYRYAAVSGLDTTVEDEAKALSAYKDAGQLTFGKTAMAWCVEQGIMGVDTDSLSPLANMSRAEMAATAVRVQPEKIA